MSACQEQSGFLFKHACSQPATNPCQRCGKGVCAEHVHPTPSGYLCTTCAKNEVQRTRAQGQQWSGWDDSPYLYDTYYYTGYGYYGRGYWGSEYAGDDFTEADGGAFGGGGASGSWDHDIASS